jgi:predicted transcriptional regulator
MWTTGGFNMRTVILGVSTREKSKQRLIEALEGKPQGSFISFESPELLFKVISGKRWDLLKVMTGVGPISIREAARLLGRDVKAVHGDVHKLLNVGILQKTQKGQIEFPFDTVHVDFMLEAA